MLKKRVIPILLLMNGWIVQSNNFKIHKKIGNPETSISRLSSWGSDELIFLDITRNNNYDYGREDIFYKTQNSNTNNFLDIIKKISKNIFMPFAVGGKISTLQDIEKRLVLGSEKIVINTINFNDKKFLSQAIQEFGAQSIVVSIDFFKNESGQYDIYSNGGTIKQKTSLNDYLSFLEDNSPGEIMINSMNRDGEKNGYDLELLHLIDEKVKHIPLICAGGVGKWEHFEEAINKTNFSAFAAANIFHHVDQATYLAKKFLYDKGCPVRPAKILDI